MSLPLNLSTLLLAKEAIDKAPRFATALMQAGKSESPVMVERHDKDDRSGVIRGIGVVAKWSAKLAGASLIGWGASYLSDKLSAPNGTAAGEDQTPKNQV